MEQRWFSPAVMAGVLFAVSACEPGSSPKQGAGPEAASSEIGGPATRESEALFAGDFQAVGVEPFWTLDILADWVSFQRLNLPTVGGLPSARQLGAKGMSVEAGPLRVTLMQKPCVHVSGETYPFSASVRYEGVVYTGCARPSQNDAGAELWTNQLGELLPAIDTCLARVKARPAHVTFAYRTEQDEVSVRLLDEEGGRFECITDERGGRIRYYEAIGDRDVLTGERDPIFSRAPGPALSGPCLKSEPAPNDVGFFTRRVC